MNILIVITAYPNGHWNRQASLRDTELAEKLISRDETNKPYILKTKVGNYLMQNCAKENPAAIFGACQVLVSLLNSGKIPSGTTVLIPADKKEMHEEPTKETILSGVKEIFRGTGINSVLLPAPPKEIPSKKRRLAHAD